MPELYWHIAKCDLFRHLDAEEIRRIESVSQTRRVRRGETIYLPADAADGVLLVVSGRIKICHLTGEGKQSILVFVEPGEVFGELALIDPTTRNECAEAVEATQLVLIPREDLQRAMMAYPQLSHGITKLIGLRRRRIERRLKNLLFHSNRERLVHLLLELVEQYGRVDEDGIELTIKLSHQEMANIIGSTRETVTVVLGELQKENLIEIARRRVRIINIDELAGQAAVQVRVPSAEPHGDQGTGARLASVSL